MYCDVMQEFCDIHKFFDVMLFLCDAFTWGSVTQLVAVPSMFFFGAKLINGTFSCPKRSIHDQHLK